MKKISFLLFCVLSGCSVKNDGSFSLRDHFSKCCNILLPEDLTIIHEYDSGEGQAEILYRGKKENIKSLITQYNFLPLDSMGRNDDPKDSSFVAMLKEAKIEICELRTNSDPKYKLAGREHLLFFEICKNQNSLTIFADTISNLIWCHDQYPDMAGDGPDCK